MNTTKAFIDFFAWIGLAYDLKTVPERIIRSRIYWTGDGSHPFALEDSQYTSDDMKSEEEPFCEIIPEEKLNWVEIYVYDQFQFDMFLFVF